MLESILLDILLVVMTTVIHYESLALASKMVERHVLGARRTIFSLVLLLPLIHLLEVSLYAVASRWAPENCSAQPKPRMSWCSVRAWPA